MAVIAKIHIVATPDVLGGKPRIDGTRIAVEHIAIAYNTSLSIDKIMESYQGITHADVFAALAYYHDHKAEMDTKIEQDEKEYKKLYQENMQQTSDLRRQLKERGKNPEIIRAD